MAQNPQSVSIYLNLSLCLNIYRSLSFRLLLLMISYLHKGLDSAGFLNMIFLYFFQQSDEWDMIHIFLRVLSVKYYLV